MRFTVDGVQFDLDAATVIGSLHGHIPELIQTHWVQVSGTRFPVKQALEVVLGINRQRFTSHAALVPFARLGFPTSTASQHDRPRATPVRQRRAGETAAQPVTVEDAGAAFATLVAFLRSTPLTESVGGLEHRLVHKDRTTVAAAVADAGLTEQLLQAALTVRRDVGRVSDVIHAAVISLALPAILEEGEVISNRPSLGPGNDSSRPFDLETNRRVAEFKVAVWSGGDMARKRTLTADLVHLAMDESSRRPELWVAGPEPLRFLQTSTSTVNSLLSRSASRHLRAAYEDRYGTGDIPLRTFTAQHASHVALRNIADVLPAVAAALL